MKVKKRFYVAADRVTSYGSDWAHETLDEAIEHAKSLLDGDPHGVDTKYVVEVIRCVRRQKTPVVVEKITT